MDLASGRLVSQNTWPRFRGPNADGVAPDNPGLPTTWTTIENVRWATDVPGCRDIVQAGEPGLWVPARDSEALAQAVLTLINDPQLRHDLGDRARRSVVANFSQQLIIHQTLALYQQSLTAHEP